MMNLPLALCALGLGLGALMGAGLLLRPRASHLSIGLASSPEKSGGVGESRAFGAMFVGLHGGALALIFGADSPTAAWVLMIVSLLLTFGWTGAFIGRLISIMLDREGLGLNLRLLALDAAMAGLIAAPLYMRANA